MRLSLLIACCLAATVSDALNTPLPSSLNDISKLDLTKDVIDDLFAMFKQLFGKDSYSTLEEQSRKTIFKRNLELIQANNLNYSTGLSTFKMGITQFCDMDPSEVVNQYTGYLLPNVSEATDPSLLYEPDLSQLLPSAVDWREKGYVTPVKSQGSCSSCWAFSALHALEGQHFKKTGSLEDLSEQQLIDCSSGNSGCSGGWPPSAFNYIASNPGIDTEQSYSYTAKDGPVCKYDPASVAANCTGYNTVQADETALMTAVAFVGPISVAIDASPRSFQLYKSGVYDDEACSSTKPNHAVTIVGYGSSQGKPYWIVKNSWGAKWGLKGYINMSRNKNNQCGIASYGSFPVV